MRAIVLFLLNNIVTNRVLIWFGKDHIIKKFKANWSRTTFNTQKTVQENMGFSHDERIQVSINLVHQKIQEVFRRASGKTVLDVGCGAGLYLSDFQADTDLFGTDLSAEFLEKAKSLVKNGKFYCEDYRQVKFEKKFDFIYSVSVLQYIPPSCLAIFFQKLVSDLNSGGIVVIQYPHALSKWDTLYPDLSYVQYSPLKVKQQSERFFDVVDHVHSFDGRQLNLKFDNQRYDTELEKSFRNGAIIVLKKN